MPDWLTSLLHWLAMPEAGLGALFVVAFVSATLLPMGSEAALFGLLKLNPELLWPAIAVATAGNTLGGAFSWWMGLAAHKAVDKARHGLTTFAAKQRWFVRVGFFQISSDHEAVGHNLATITDNRHGFGNTALDLGHLGKTNRLALEWQALVGQ